MTGYIQRLVERAAPVSRPAVRAPANPFGQHPVRAADSVPQGAEIDHGTSLRASTNTASAATSDARTMSADAADLTSPPQASDAPVASESVQGDSHLRAVPEEPAVVHPEIAFPPPDLFHGRAPTASIQPSDLVVPDVVDAGPADQPVSTRAEPTTGSEVSAPLTQEPNPTPDHERPLRDQAATTDAPTTATPITGTPAPSHDLAPDAPSPALPAQPEFANNQAPPAPTTISPALGTPSRPAPADAPSDTMPPAPVAKAAEPAPAFALPVTRSGPDLEPPANPTSQPAPSSPTDHGGRASQKMDQRQATLTAASSTPVASPPRATGLMTAERASLIGALPRRSRVITIAGLRRR